MNNHDNNCIPRENFESWSDVDESRCRVPAWKRAFDIICVLVASVFWLPVCLLIWIFIKITSPGPVLFRQERIGHMGRTFHCLKFRTMLVNASTGVHQTHLRQLMNSKKPMQKLDHAGDKRLIAGGVWLRALGVDELPQLINVLKGEMSLVGPRPCIAYEFEMFQPRHRRRCLTLPGLTGLWQVNGKNRTTFERMMELDLSYVERKSLFLDVKIIVGTPFTILQQMRDTRKSRDSAKRKSSGLVTARAAFRESPLPGPAPEAVLICTAALELPAAP